MWVKHKLYIRIVNGDKGLEWTLVAPPVAMTKRSESVCHVYPNAHRTAR